MLSMELFFNSNSNKNIKEVVFDSFESSHICKSKRKKIGDTINFTDGNGNLYQGQIKKIKPEVITNCKYVEKFEFPEIEIIMAIGFIRPNRLDFLIEKSTEIGINKFILFSGKHSNYFTENIGRWQKISRQAIKQSLRYFLPQIETEKNFNSLIDNQKNADIKIIAEQNSNTNLSEIQTQIDQNNVKKIIFIVGPEGGLSKNEIDLAANNGYKTTNIGNHRLRTETAALVLSSFFCLNIN